MPPINPPKEKPSASTPISIIRLGDKYSYIIIKILPIYKLS